MAKWSGIRAKLEKEYLAPSLRGRIQYFATTYSKCPDHEGRASVRLDGKEILKSSYYEYCLAYWSPYSESVTNCQDLSERECRNLRHQAALDGGDFDQRDFYQAFQEFDNQSIEKSLSSSNPIVRLFALLDRRVGKRKLAALGETMKDEIAWLQLFYDLRMKVEGMAVKQE